MNTLAYFIHPFIKSIPHKSQHRSSKNVSTMMMIISEPSENVRDVFILEPSTSKGQF